MQQVSPGYYPDPYQPGAERWWNGLEWGPQVRVARRYMNFRYPIEDYRHFGDIETRYEYSETPLDIVHAINVSMRSSSSHASQYFPVPPQHGHISPETQYVPQSQGGVSETPKQIIQRNRKEVKHAGVILAVALFLSLFVAGAVYLVVTSYKASSSAGSVQTVVNLHSDTNEDTAADEP